MSDKVNDSGYIPELKEAKFQGRIVYYKEVSLAMGIFQGVGISQSVLERSTKHGEIVIRFHTDGKDKRYNGYYLATLDQFRHSDKKFANGYADVQRFVSFADMKKVL